MIPLQYRLEAQLPTMNHSCWPREVRIQTTTRRGDHRLMSGLSAPSIGGSSLSKELNVKPRYRTPINNMVNRVLLPARTDHAAPTVPKRLTNRTPRASVTPKAAPAARIGAA